jgi:hypothetical protein
MVAWRRTGSAVVATALALTGAATALAATSTATPARGPAPVAVEAATCAAPTALPALDDRRTDGDTQVSFQVPALTRLRVEGGAVVAAATNTGCTPRAGDRFVVDDRLATATESAAAVATSWTGDWTTPGTWHLVG